MIFETYFDILFEMGLKLLHYFLIIVRMNKSKTLVTKHETTGKTERDDG